MPGILDNPVGSNPVLQVDPNAQGFHGTGPGILGGGPNITLEKAYDAGPPLQVYKIMRDGNYVGEVHAGTMGPGNLTIHNVFAVDSKGNPTPPEDAANSLGLGVMRGVLSGLRQLYPGATNITGNRISGAIQGGSYSEGAKAPKLINLPGL